MWGALLKSLFFVGSSLFHRLRLNFLSWWSLKFVVVWFMGVGWRQRKVNFQSIDLIIELLSQRHDLLRRHHWARLFALKIVWQRFLIGISMLVLIHLTLILVEWLFVVFREIVWSLYFIPEMGSILASWSAISFPGMPEWV